MTSVARTTALSSISEDIFKQEMERASPCRLRIPASLYSSRGNCKYLNIRTQLMLCLFWSGVTLFDLEGVSQRSLNLNQVESRELYVPSTFHDSSFCGSRDFKGGGEWVPVHTPTHPTRRFNNFSMPTATELISYRIRKQIRQNWPMFSKFRILT